jgi:phage gpG-like protein
MSVLNLFEMAAEITAAAANMEVAKAAVIKGGCVILSSSAKDAIGTYKFGWPQLAPETLKHKDGVNTPLLESGELRASIHWTADASEGWIGTNDPVGKYQEYGTFRGIPPRPFLGGAIEHSIGDVEKMAQSVVAAALGGAVGGSELWELLRLAKHSAEKVADFGSEIVHSEDEQR